MKYLPLNPSIFINNRKRFAEKMVKNAIAIFNSNDEMPANGDSLYPFQQNSDLFWLSGILQEDVQVRLALLAGSGPYSVVIYGGGIFSMPLACGQIEGR